MKKEWEDVLLYWKKNHRESFDNFCDLAMNYDILPFIGSGMSMDVGYPSWEKFLNDAYGKQDFSFNGLDKDKQAQLIDKNTNKGIEFEILDKYRSQIIETKIFNTPDYAQNSYISHLIKYGIRRFVTTNYDTCIENLYKVLTDSDLDVRYPKADKTSLNNLSSPFVFKLHGSVDVQESSIVLTYKQYDSVYASCAIPSFIEKLWRNNTCLFIGWGFPDDPLHTKVLKGVSGKNCNRRHYAIVSHKEKNLDKLKQYHIHPIVYNASNRDQVNVILEMLANSQTILLTRFLRFNSQYFLSEKFEKTAIIATLRQKMSDVVQILNLSSANPDEIISFQNIADYIQNNHLNLIGKSGCGKSLLLGMLYLSCLRNESDCLYVDLEGPNDIIRLKKILSDILQSHKAVYLFADIVGDIRVANELIRFYADELKNKTIILIIASVVPIALKSVCSSFNAITVGELNCFQQKKLVSTLYNLYTRLDVPDSSRKSILAISNNIMKGYSIFSICNALTKYYIDYKEEFNKLSWTNRVKEYLSSRIKEDVDFFVENLSVNIYKGKKYVPAPFAMYASNDVIYKYLCCLYYISQVRKKRNNDILNYLLPQDYNNTLSNIIQSLSEDEISEVVGMLLSHIVDLNVFGKLQVLYILRNLNLSNGKLKSTVKKAILPLYCAHSDLTLPFDSLIIWSSSLCLIKYDILDHVDKFLNLYTSKNKIRLEHIAFHNLYYHLRKPARFDKKRLNIDMSKNQANQYFDLTVNSVERCMQFFSPNSNHTYSDIATEKIRLLTNLTIMDFLIFSKTKEEMIVERKRKFKSFLLHAIELEIYSNMTIGYINGLLNKLS